ncbi:VOC family protein [Paenibacillus woosongensis]|uniref:VOC family protein n=1 Tax=Paenibacillus woosongensis TaxID=307580 RepID=A0AA95I632_9BACL|nr:VOC family protein [Paenibacillus woosongensis]WHX51299.1 VOC family protein [Paenibacillus woosongensis]
MAQIIHPQAEIGLVRLKVQNLERSIAFYEEVIGLKLLKQEGNVAELAADGRHALVVLEANDSYRISASRSSGLYHFAILLPDRVSLGLALRNLAKHNVSVGQGDHLVSEALYLNDPDNNGIEIYADRPRETWQRSADGEYVMTTDPVDIEGLLHISEQAQWQGLPADTVIGHVHFHVGDLRQAKHFYCDVLGFEVSAHYGSAALFISAGGYHHHIGLNTWAGVGAPPAAADATGLAYYTVTLPHQQALAEVEARIIEAGLAFERVENAITVNDPFGIQTQLIVKG